MKQKNTLWSLNAIEEGRSITLTGFLFQTEESNWILSNEPDLKTCCIGAKHKRESQITLLGNFSNYTEHLPLKVTGTLHKNEMGSYALSDANITQNISFPYWTVGIVGSLLLAFVGIRLKRLLLP
ncbi:MAG: hypothetical protein S4CHLAM123_01230 [Chlamydiales bacterium]|nr:hypothetical protein [Chlamydiales bacterium]